MAGKDHHHIWRMLQRGFGEKRGKDHHVWVYQKGVEPSQKGTGNFGVEKFFYGPEDSETDKIITDFENSVQGNIQDARKMDDGAELNSAFVAPLIAHLEVRSNFLRSEMRNKIEWMQTAISNHAASPIKVKNMMKDYLKKNPKVVDEFLAKNFVPSGQRETASEWINIYIDNLPTSNAAELFDLKIADIFRMANLTPEGIKEAHNKAILSVSSENPRIKELSEFNFNVYRPKVGSFILPDTCCAFAGSKNVAPFSQPDDGMYVVILPISAEVAIFGYKDRKERMELKTINRLLAGCSYDAFIARTNDPLLRSLSSRIGKYAKLINDNELREMFTFERMLQT